MKPLYPVGYFGALCFSEDSSRRRVAGYHPQTSFFVFIKLPPKIVWARTCVSLATGVHHVTSSASRALAPVLACMEICVHPHPPARERIFAL